MSYLDIWASPSIKRSWEEKISQKAVGFFEKIVESNKSPEFKTIEQYTQETHIPKKYFNRVFDFLHELGLIRIVVNGDRFSCSFELPIEIKPPEELHRPLWATDKRKNKSISLKTRKEIYKLDDGICAYCGISIDLHVSKIDHIYPDSKGGADNIDNMTLACEECNRKKWSWIPGDSDFMNPKHFRGKLVKNVTYEKRDGYFYPVFTFL